MLNSKYKISVLFFLLLVFQSIIIAQKPAITGIPQVDIKKDTVSIGYYLTGDSLLNYNIKLSIKNHLLPNFALIPGVMNGAIGIGKFANKRNYIHIPKDQIPRDIGEKTYYEITVSEVEDSLIFGATKEVSQRYNSFISDGVSIIIGVEPENNKLQYIQNGAKLFEEYCMRVLKISADKRRLLLNKEVLIESLKNYFRIDGWLHNCIKDGTTDVIIYFAGQCKIDEKSHRIYLLASGPNDGISLDDLISQIEAFNPKSVTFFLEPFIKSKIDIRNRADYYYPGHFSDKINIMMACRWDQKSYNNEQEKVSLFTYEILQGLSGAADLNKDKIITFNELYEYVKKNVWDYSVNNFNKEQDPILIPSLDMNKGKSDLIFIERK